MNFDYYYEIGSSHKICQDYATAGTVKTLYKDGIYVKDDLTYAIVCDGCSMTGDSIQIDTGARLAALSAITSLKNYDIARKTLHNGEEPVPVKFIEILEEDAGNTLGDFYLSNRYFDSTVWLAVTGEKILKIYSIGDGGFFIKRKNTNIVQFTTVEYESGAPLYLSYLLRKSDLKLYMDQFGDKDVKVKTYWIDIDSQKIVDFSFYSHKAKDNSKYFQKSWVYDVENIECVGVFSDGIHSFMKDKNPVSFEKIASEFASFKNYNGKFVDRRLANGLSKKCKQEGIVHYDDISCAVIRL